MTEGLVKVSDYVADFLARAGVRHAFVVSGGASLHLIHSIAAHPQIEHVCPQHEQAGAMAADAYARLSGNLGAAIATSGPGATNLITGICCAHFDSVPVLFVTGNVSSFRLRGESGVRQLGFQETDIVAMVRPVTKYAALVDDPRRIRHELEKALFIARSGRPGPVLIDICDDVQRKQVDPAQLDPFVPEPPAPLVPTERLREVAALCGKAERPVLVLGWGVRLAGAASEALALAERLGFPILPTWGVLDLIPAGHPLLVGSFGTHGTRYGNYAVQNADLVVSIGSRLDTHMTGTPSEFARGARKVVVDIDPAELRKFDGRGLQVDLPVVMDAGEFVRSLTPLLPAQPARDLTPWFRTIADWQRRYPQLPTGHDPEGIDPYALVGALSEALEPDDVVFMDTGCGVAWMGQAFRIKAGQRVFSAFNNTPMGYGLPAALGGAFQREGRRVICLTGDGGLQLNIQELVTVAHHALPVKVLLLNNRGHAMIRQTQDQWLDSRYVASGPEGGVGQPDFQAVARAYGIPAEGISRPAEVVPALARWLSSTGPGLLDVRLSPDHRVVPQVKFGHPIEDPEPLLSRAQLAADMIVPPLSRP